jgi:DNA-binding IclR family transcriptional regulator
MNWEPDLSETVKSAQRALEVLELLTSHEAPMTFTDIAARLGYPRSSLHGLMRTLVDRGWADYDETGRRYALGLRTLEAGNAYTRSLSLVERATPLMAHIRDVLEETVQLAVLDGLENVYVAKIDGRQALTLASEVGRRLPAHATGVGKVLLAGLSPGELDRRLAGVRLARFTPSTITRRDGLHAALDTIRQRGFGMDNEEYTPGVQCVAVPIRDHGGRTVAAMSVSVPTIRFAPRLRERAHGLLADAAARISAALGHLEVAP